MNYNCRVCGNIYQSSRSSCYCSKECRRIGINEKSRAYKKRWRAAKPKNFKIYDCVICSKKIEALHPTKYCSKECKDVVLKEYRKGYKEEKKEQIKKSNAAYYVKNKKRINERNNKYIEDNREKVKERQRVYRQNNKDSGRIHLANRRARKRNATLDIDISDDFKNIYKESVELENSTGIKMNVDHIIPLKHDDICGLHAPWNLQILTFTENMKKSNKFDGTYENETWKDEL